MASSKEKKRKRGDEGASPPSKKVAVQKPEKTQKTQKTQKSTPTSDIPEKIKVASVQIDNTCPPVIGKSLVGI